MQKTTEALRLVFEIAQRDYDFIHLRSVHVNHIKVGLLGV